MFLRYAYVAVFLVGIACAVACGRQVTPNPSISGLSGEVLIKFRTIGPANFSLYNYFVAVNTTGNGQEPYASGFTAGQYQDFSYAIVTGAAYGGLGEVLPLLVQYYLVPGQQQAGFRVLNLNPSTTQLLLNTAQTTNYNEFQIIVSRSQLSLAPPTATTPPATSAPTPTPKPTNPTPKPTPTPSTTPTSPSGGPTPVSSPTIASQATWCINLFTTGPPGLPVYDALGSGAGDHSFSSGCFDVNTYEDIVYNQVLPEPLGGPQDPSSALFGFELINYP